MPRILGETYREPRLMGGTKETFLLVRGLDLSEFNLSESELEDAKAYIKQLKKEEASPDQMAEQMWAFREQLVRALQGVEVEDGEDKKAKRLERIQGDPELRFAAAVYRVLSADSAIAEKAGERLARQRQERERINGTYAEYQKYHNEFTEKEEALNKLLADLFRERGKEPKPTLIARRTLLEARIDELVNLLKEVKNKNPYTAAQIEYEKILEYARQLRQYGFIWTDSRRRLMKEVLTDALSSRPVAALYGETGAGKTAMARAASLKLTGREPERAVGGPEEQFRRILVGTQNFREDGSVYYEFGMLLRAMTGKDSSLDQMPKRGGGIYFDDEFNTRPTSVQREILKFAAEARPGRKIAVPGTSLVVEVQPGFLYLAAGNPPGDRYEREETGIETKREFAANVVNVGYLEQSKDNPELHQVLLAALMNTATKRLSFVSRGEVAPHFFKDPSSGEEKLDLSAANGGFLWRFANCWHELFKAFSRQPTILHKKYQTATPETYYLQEFVLDPGVVISWIDQYKASPKAARESLEEFFKGKLAKYISQFSEADKGAVYEYLDHFGINLAAEAKAEKPPFVALTPQEIGFLSPNVPRPKTEGRRPPEGLEKSTIPDEEGNDILYVEKPLGDIAIGMRFESKKGFRTKVKEWMYIGHTEEGRAVMKDERATGYVVSVEDLRKDYEEKRAPEAGRFQYNEREAKRLGLEAMELSAYPEADKLISRILESYTGTDKIDISTQAGQNKFCEEWNRLVPGLPPPCVPTEGMWKKMKFFKGKDYPASITKTKGNFWYLNQLKAEKIITNLLDIQKPDGSPMPNKIANPRFGEAEFLLVDTWEERDFSASDAATVHTSALLKELLGGTSKISTVSIKRETIDAALWEGDPAGRKPTDKHKEILKKLGINITEYELRLIAQDEYARGAVTRGWGQKELWTNFDHYFLEDVARHGLAGGYRGHGGPSDVDCRWRVGAISDLAVRLVLSRKR